MTVTIKSVTDTTVTVAGWGMVFGGNDLDGEQFTRDTDLMLDLVPVKPVLYDHGQRMVKHFIGKVTKAEVSDEGVWVEAELDRHAEYVDHVMRLVEKGALGWSSGSVGHLTRREGGVIKAWPVVEWSLTPTPAEPRTVGVEVIKSLMAHDPSFEALLPDDVKALDESDLKPTDPMKAEAQRGLEWRQEYNRGGTEVGVARARDIVNGRSLSPDTWKRMYSFFSRHEVDKQGQGFSPGEEGYPSAGRIAWALWGGDPGYSRAKALVARMDEKSVSSFEALEPEAEAATSAAGADDVHDIEPEPIAVPEEKNIVSNENVQAADYMADLIAEVKSLKAALSAEPAVNAPSVNLKTKRGDDETKATAYYIRTGDAGAIKASNNTDMNVGTNADGGFAVPTGHYQGIIARRDEMRLDNRLGVRQIPGRGLTVNVPVDNEADGEFVTKSEATAFDRDAPAIGQVQMTLVKYTKTVEISDELMQDEDSNLMAFLNDWIGRGIGRTYNSLFLTELRAGGTAALTLDSASTIGVTEVPELVYKLQPEYRDNTAWIMSNSTEGLIRSLASSNEFQFAPSTTTRSGSPELWGFPVHVTSYASDVAASAKSLIFGNYSYVGVRDGGIQFMRNPYLLANSGQVALHYYFRVVFKVLQSEAIVYATHPSA